MARYFIKTWDAEVGYFAPQDGVAEGPYSLFTLRRALRLLRGCGYSADRHDPSIYVWRDDAPEATP